MGANVHVGGLSLACGEEEEEDHLEREAQLKAQEVVSSSKKADEHLVTVPRQRFAAMPKPRRRWWLLWLLSLQQTGASAGNLPSHVTDCGNGWFSKITSPAVDAGAICASFGYTSIDMFGGNWGIQCNPVNNQAGNCVWGQTTCDVTVSWHCAGITATTTTSMSSVSTTSSTAITVTTTFSSTETTATSTLATTTATRSSTKSATTSTITPISTTSSGTETMSTNSFTTTGVTTSATRSTTSYTNTKTEVTSTTTTSFVSTTTTQSKSSQTESSSNTVTLTTITETTSRSSSITSSTSSVTTITKTSSGTNSQITSSVTTTTATLSRTNTFTSTSITPSVTTITKSLSSTDPQITSSVTTTTATVSYTRTYTSTSITPSVTTTTKTLSSTRTHVTSSATTLTTTFTSTNTNTLTSITPSATTITKTLSSTRTHFTSTAATLTTTFTYTNTSRLTSITPSATTFTETFSSTNTPVTSSVAAATTTLSYTNTYTFTSATPRVTTTTQTFSSTITHITSSITTITTTPIYTSTRSWTTSTIAPSTTRTTMTSTTYTSTSTVTATETVNEMTSTTTGTTTTTESLCALPPQLAHGNTDALSRCAGLRHGQECESNCSAGFFHTDHGLRIKCEHGIWQVEGECLRDGANASIQAAVQTLIRVSMELWQSDRSKLTTGQRWALAHHEDLLTAFAQTVGRHPSQLRLDLLEAVQSRRLELSNSTGAGDTSFVPLANSSGKSFMSVPIVFDARVTLLLGHNASEQDLQQAAKDLASMTTAQQGEALVTALDNQLQTRDSGILVPTGISASAIGSVITIAEYVLPAAQWIVGDWDTSACYLSCEDRVPRSTAGPHEEREVLCSRGPVVACLGPEASQAGPMPVLVQVCSACAKSFFADKWVIFSALPVACCCGIFAGVVCFRCHRSGHWAMQGTYRLKNLAGIEAKFQVRTPQQTNNPETDFGMDAELGVRPRVSRRGSSASVASSKKHIVWEVDMEKVSSFFAKQGSALWDQQLKRYQSQQSLQSEQREGLGENAFPSQLGRQRSGTLLDACRPDAKSHGSLDEIFAMRV